MDPDATPAPAAAVQEKPTNTAPAAEPRRLAVNYAYLTAGECTAKLLTFASFSYLARVLGPAHYGFLEFTLAVMVFFTLPTDLGLSWYGAREIARNPGSAARLLHEITGLRMVLALCSMLGLSVFILAIQKSVELKILLALYGASLLAGPFLLGWFFQGQDRMVWVAVASIIRQAGFAGLVFLMCRRGTRLMNVGLVECASVAVTAAFCVYATRRRLGFAWPWPDLRAGLLMGHLKEAVPIGLTELAWAFMWYFCTVLLGFLYSDGTVGWFGASHRTVMALHTFVYLYFFNLLPSISRCAALPHSYLLELMDRSIRFAAWTGLMVSALLTAVAPELLGLIYGRDYRAAAGSFRILVWILPVAMLSGHHRFILIGYSRQGWLLGCGAISAAAAVLLGLALEPSYGGPGAACALLIATCLNFALVYVTVRRLVVSVPVGRQLAAPLAALAVSAAFYGALARWNIPMALAGGSAAYVAGLTWSDGPQLAAFLRTVVSKPAGGAV
jgi:O-antigen/teichoic acid export membrane protein